MKSPLRVIAITRKPDSASFEHRVQDYIQPLSQRGVQMSVRPLPAGFFSQQRFLKSLSEAQVIFWHRHLLHPMLRSTLRGIGRPIVFDFDDPLVYSSSGGYRPSATRRRRFAGLLKQCAAATAGSDSLAELARPHVENIHVIPMAVPMHQQPAPRRAEPIELLWLGGATTQPYLQAIAEALDQIGQARPQVVLRLVAHRPMNFGALTVDYRKWAPQQQEQALQECHIGLCPMPDTPWTRGKCPYKVLQYMAYGMPWVGSAVGENVNTAGVSDAARARGICAQNSEQWTAALIDLIDDADRRQRMGQHGRQYIQQTHSLDHLSDQLAKLFNSLVT